MGIDAARVHISLAEYALGALESPDAAERHLEKARTLAPRSSAVFGLATYDLALVKARRGQYKVAAARFEALLSAKPALVGVNRGTAALWLNHLRKRIGYHEANRKAGIPQADRMDPMCGVKSLTPALAQVGIKSGLEELKRIVRPSGLGSNIFELKAAAEKLGASARVVSSSDAALKALPKPLIAFVEHDHFVAVTKADSKGVEYLCGGCAGVDTHGSIRLSWKQWHRMEANTLLVLVRKGSATDAALAAVLSERGTANRRPMALAQRGGFGAIRQLRGQISLIPAFHGVTPQTCIGWSNQTRGKPWSEELVDGDPVSVATGEEIHIPAPDLLIHNPNGPSVTWQRIYRSFPNKYGDQNANHRGEYGYNWTHPYDVLVHDSNLGHVRQMVHSVSTSLTAMGSDPTASLPWEVSQGGTVVASSSVPNGWSVPFSGPASIGVIPPASASGGSYRIRWKVFSSPKWHYPFSDFDVVNPNQIPQDDKGRAAVTSTLTGQSGLKWEVLKGGTSKGSETQPNGWNVNWVSATAFDVSVPTGAQLGSDYTFRWLDNSGKRYFGSFEVLPARLVLAPGAKTIILPSGARVSFTAPNIPSVGVPTVSCTVEPGAPLAVRWKYDASDPYGYYEVVGKNGSVQEFRAIPWVPASGRAWITYNLRKLSDCVGNAIAFNYSYGTSTNIFPVLSTINDVESGTSLLTLERGGPFSYVSAASDVHGRTVKYTYSGSSLGTVSHIVPTGTPNPAVKTTYGYTVIQLQPMLTSVTEPSPTGTGTSTWTFTYHPTLGYVTSQTDPTGNKRRYVEVDANHTKIIVEDPTGNVAHSFTVGFDALTNETTRTDGTNTTVISTKVYGDPDNPYSPSSITDGTSRNWTFDYDSFGNLLSAVTPRGVQRTLTYDHTNFPLGRLVSTGETGSPATYFTYYEPSGLLETLVGPSAAGGTTTTSYTYNAKGNVLTMTEPGNGTSPTRTLTYGYTVDGSYTQPEVLGKPIVITDHTGKKVHNRYDSQGLPISITDPLGLETNITYNIAGQPLAIIEPASGTSGIGRAYELNGYLFPGGPKLTETYFDESGVQTRQLQYVLGPTGQHLATQGGLEPATFTYDADYRTTSRTDGLSRTTTYSYNTAGYLDTSTLPDGSTIRTSSYDAAGRPLQRIDADGHITNISYGDPDGLPTAESHPSTPSLNRTFTYNATGRLEQVSSSVASYSYTYGSLDETLSQTTTYAGLANPITLTYTYNPDGSRASLGTPAGTFAYGYDGSGRLTSVTNPFSETSSVTYLDNGLVGTETLGNGAKTIYTYNASGEVTELVNETAGGTLLSQFNGIQRDGEQRLISFVSTVPSATQFSGTTNFTYDGMGRLLSESSTRLGGYSNTYAYDLAGNPTTFRGATTTYNSLNQHSGMGFAYNGNGHPTTYAGQSLSFDEAGRLAGAGGATYGYSPTDDRIWKETSAGRTYFIYDGLVPILELAPNGTIQAVNTSGVVGVISRRVASGSVFYQHDLRGGTVHRLDASGVPLTSHAQDAFGAPAATASTDDPYQGLGARYGYRADPESGLMLLGARYYDPGRGRFLTRDPIGIAGGFNLYAYCGNDPVNNGDPTGFSWGEWQSVNNDWGRAIHARGASAKNDVIEKLGGVPGGWFAAGTINTGMDLFTGIGTGVFWFGCGAGTFSADPSWENAPGLAGDTMIMLPFKGARGARGGRAGARGGRGARTGAKAPRVRANPSSQCFVAGTDVVVAARAGMAADEIEEGDYIFVTAKSSSAGEVLLNREDSSVTFPIRSSISSDDPGRYFRVVGVQREGFVVTFTLLVDQTGRTITIRRARTSPLLALDSTSYSAEEIREGKQLAIAGLPHSQIVATLAANHSPEKGRFTTVDIDQVREGDLVISRDPSTGLTRFKPVKHTIRSVVSELVKVEFADLHTGQTVERMVGTVEHPFFTSEGVVPMGELKAGMSAMSRRGPPLRVKSVTLEKHPKGVSVYNLEVENDHTYFIGRSEGGVWVHNGDCIEIALGREPHMQNIAEQTGAPHWKQWVDRGIIHQPRAERFGKQFSQATNKADRIHFALDDMPAHAEAMKKGSRGFFAGNMTNAEYYQIMSNPSLRAKTIFYRGGVPINVP